MGDVRNGRREESGKPKNLVERPQMYIEKMIHQKVTERKEKRTLL